VLLSKALRSSTLKLALIYVTVFSAGIFAVLSYVYWITAGHLSEQFEDSLKSEFLSLLETYDRAGHDGLAGLIDARLNDRHFNDWLYLLVDDSLRKVAGNVPAWPSEFQGSDGQGNFQPVSGAAEADPGAISGEISELTRRLPSSDWARCRGPGPAW
jgi:hypothetical protein